MRSAVTPSIFVMSGSVSRDRRRFISSISRPEARRATTVWHVSSYVEFCPILYQCLYSIQPAVACSVHERRQTAAGTLLSSVVLRRLLTLLLLSALSLSLGLSWLNGSGGWDSIPLSAALSALSLRC